MQSKNLRVFYGLHGSFDIITIGFTNIGTSNDIYLHLLWPYFAVYLDTIYLIIEMQVKKKFIN